MTRERNTELLVAKALTEYVDILNRCGVSSEEERGFWTNEVYEPVRSDLVVLCATARQLKRRYSGEETDEVPGSPLIASS